MEECWVYKLYCTESLFVGGPLYVGISDSPSSRMANHESQKWWWWLVDNVEWERFHTRADAKDCESRCIERLSPVFNHQESLLTPLERLQKQVGILWKHQTNFWDCPRCPFCDSHGLSNVLSPSVDYQVFARNCDDELVIHWDVSCDHHRSPITWANHCLVRDFLVGFGKCPRADADRLISEAMKCGAPWENRLRRGATLFECLDSGNLRSSSGEDALSIGHREEVTDGR